MVSNDKNPAGEFLFIIDLLPIYYRFLLEDETFGRSG